MAVRETYRLPVIVDIGKFRVGKLAAFEPEARVREVMPARQTAVVADANIFEQMEERLTVSRYLWKVVGKSCRLLPSIVI